MSVALLPLDRRGLSVLTVTHIFNDINQSAVPSMLPFLVARDHLSLTLGASLILAMNLSSSVVQPLFGHLSDRRSRLWIVPVSVLVASGGTACIGLVHSYAAMFIAALVAGVGVAAFHPEGSRCANYTSRDQRAAGMGWFSLGGYGGFALGPLLLTPVLLAFGMPGTVLLLVPAIVVAILMWTHLHHFDELRRSAHARMHATERAPDDWRAFSWLTLTVGLRSSAFFGAVTFLPLWTIATLHTDKATGNLALTVMLLAGAGGTLLGGQLGDRIDRRTIVAASLALVAASAAAIALSGMYHPALWIVLLLALCFGIAISLSASVVVVLGQEYLPNRIGVASGVTLGLAVSVGGIAAPIFGAIGDHRGLDAVFLTIAAIGLCGWIGTCALPQRARRAPTFAEAEEAVV